MNSKSGNPKKICIIGIGNTLRSDDGAGAYVCDLLQQRDLPVTIINTLQLDIAMAEELGEFNTVIFIDAAIDEENFSFTALTTVNSQPQSFTHHINAAMLMQLAQQLFKASTQFYVCAVGATDFEMGNNLSKKTRYNAGNAATFISRWILSNNYLSS